MAAPHPTQIFLSNPQALRAEFRLDDQRLEVWWSPKAGTSTACADRNYSSRDAHLDVFEAITLPGCDLESFQSCDYAPYHCVLHFTKQSLHLALAVDAPVVLLWCEQPQNVDLKTARFDEAVEAEPEAFVTRHTEPRYTFEFAVVLGKGDGHLRHCHFHAAENPFFASAQLAAGQLLALGVGLTGDGIRARTEGYAKSTPEALLAEIDSALAPHESTGRVVSPQHPKLEALRSGVLRGLHSMIDESAGYRASLKAIYYLMWIRDSSFSFGYQEAAGWPHKLPELCRLLLDNPTSVSDHGLPHTRMFGQLVNTHYGKLEEDGLYYVVWMLFTHWTHFGHLDFMSEADWALIDEAAAWVEAVTWDAERGLYGEHFADETPVQGSRDHGWDYAIGAPKDGRDVMCQGEAFSVIEVSGKADGTRQPIVRNYDVYFNLIMHSTYTMLAAMKPQGNYAERAGRIWPELHKLLQQRTNGIPVYAEQVLEDGTRGLSPHWGEARACCVWGLSMPNFAPLEDWDDVLAAVMDAIIANPEMHWLNGIASAMSAVDSWCYDERKLLRLHERLASETETPGKYLPMGGAMPEKFNAPQGNLYHDIRPQGFAMGAWLAAWSSLGLRRLRFGLALRPTVAFERIENFQWRGFSLHFHFGPTGRNLGLKVGSKHVEGTLQVPESLLADGQDIRLVESEPRALWLRSTVRLDSVEAAERTITYRAEAFGLASVTFSEDLESRLDLKAADGGSIDTRWATSTLGTSTVFFEHRGPFVLIVK
ncbi:MAG: hypothetical protein ACFB21_07490 [Opitutales bacterium]